MESRLSAVQIKNSKEQQSCSLNQLFSFVQFIYCQVYRETVKCLFCKLSSQITLYTSTIHLLEQHKENCHIPSSSCTFQVIDTINNIFPDRFFLIFVWFRIYGITQVMWLHLYVLNVTTPYHPHSAGRGDDTPVNHHVPGWNLLPSTLFKRSFLSQTCCIT